MNGQDVKGTDRELILDIMLVEMECIWPKT